MSTATMSMGRGQMGSFTAVPGEPGASVPLVYFHNSVDANASKTFIVGGNLVAGLSATANLLFIAPTYTFTQPLGGAQAAIKSRLACGSCTRYGGRRGDGPAGKYAVQEPHRFRVGRRPNCGTRHQAFPLLLAV